LKTPLDFSWRFFFSLVRFFSFETNKYLSFAGGMKKKRYLAILLICLQALVYSDSLPDSFFIPLFPKSSLDRGSTQDRQSYRYINRSIEKSNKESSGKTTRKVRLDNGMQVYLISDPEAASSAAAVSVSVGSWNNPVQHPGMAHFVEHLLFMGTKKFPRESEFQQYVLDRGGDYNAFTSYTSTVYSFTLPGEGFEGALERFSRFFIDPIFSLASINREMHAVDHEFQDCAEDNIQKFMRVFKAIGNPLHPNAIFSCGNLTSLSQISQIAIKQWYADHYVGLNMNLVIISPLPIDEIESLVLAHFPPISAKSPKKQDSKEPISYLSQHGHFIHIDASSNTRELILLWEVPHTVIEQSGVMPLEIARIAIDHEGRKSFSDILFRRGLCNTAGAEYVEFSKDRILFVFSVSLTRKGIQQIDEVITTCFQAVHAMEKTGSLPALQDYIIAADESIREADHEGSPFNLVMGHALALLNEPLDTYPCKNSILQKVSDTDFLELLHLLTPENCMFFLLAPSVETGIEMSQVEKWMGALYHAEAVPIDKLREWSLSVENPVITILDSVGQGSGDQEKEEWNRGRASIEFIIDPSLTEDALKVRLLMKNPRLTKDIRYGAFVTFWRCLLRQQLQGLCFADIDTQIDGTVGVYDDEIDMGSDRQIHIRFDCLGKNQIDRLRQILSVVMGPVIDNSLFEEVKRLSLDLDPGHLDPAQFAENIAEAYLSPGVYSASDLFCFLSKMTLEEYQRYMGDFIASMELEGFLYVGESIDDARKCWEGIGPCLIGASGSWEVGDTEEPKIMLTSLTAPVVLKRTTNRKGHSVLVMLNLGECDSRSWAAQQIISQVLKHEFFVELRTSQQTAYSLDSSPRIMEDQLFQSLSIQSATHTPEDLSERIELFLDFFSKNFTQRVSSDRINLIRHSLIAHLKKRGQKLSDQAKLKIRALETVSDREIQDMAINMFSLTNPKRLSVLVKGGVID
jgi:insulysin